MRAVTPWPADPSAQALAAVSIGWSSRALACVDPMPQPRPGAAPCFGVAGAVTAACCSGRVMPQEPSSGSSRESHTWGTSGKVHKVCVSLKPQGPPGWGGGCGCVAAGDMDPGGSAGGWSFLGLDSAAYLAERSLLSLWGHSCASVRTPLPG